MFIFLLFHFQQHTTNLTTERSQPLEKKMRTYVGITNSGLSRKQINTTNKKVIGYHIKERKRSYHRSLTVARGRRSDLV